MSDENVNNRIKLKLENRISNLKLLFLNKNGIFRMNSISPINCEILNKSKSVLVPNM